MLRTYLVTGIVIALAVVATPARADHDRELGYIVGGALIGAAIGGIVYNSHRHARHYPVDTHYHYAPIHYYAPAYRYVHRHSRHYRGRYHGHRHIGYRHVHHRH